MINRVSLSILVQNCSCLFDVNDPEYGDKRKVAASWQAIASVLNTSISEVQKEWLKCCEIYHKCRADVDNATLDQDTKKLLLYMNFIEPHLLNKSFPYMIGAPESTRRNSDGPSNYSADRRIAAVRLIRLVQKHPVLYDRKDVFYRNKKKTEEAWNNIATTLGENAKQCSNKWKNLRKSFRIYIKTKTSIGKVANGQKSHPYAKELKFLIPVLAESVIHDTCKYQRRIVENGEAVEVIEIPESEDEDDDESESEEEEEEEDEEEGENLGEEDKPDVNNREVDSTVNDESKTEEKASTDEQVSSKSRTEKRTNTDEHVSPYSSKRVKGETQTESPSNNEPEISINGYANNDDDNNNTIHDEETGSTENGKEYDLKTPTLERFVDLESNPDMLFFRSLLPELQRMSRQQKNKFKMAVLTSIDEILSD